VRSRRTAIAVPALGLLLFGTASCNILNYFIQTASSPPTPTLSYFADYGVAAYADPTMFFGTPNPDDIADDFKTDMIGLDAVEAASGRDAAITTNVLAASESKVDVLWFSGHGEPGMLELTDAEESGAPTNLTAWGPGPTSDGFTTSTTGLPVSGRLKWIFAYSSGSVGVPPSALPGYPNFTTNWSIAFGSGLHGIYGFGFQPGNCTGAGISVSGTCDIDTSTGPAFANAIANHLLNESPQETVHGAWVNAANDVGFTGLWSMYEDASNFGDLLSGPGGPNQAPSGTVEVYWAQSPLGIQLPATSVRNDTFALVPTSLVPEQINDQAELQSAQSYFGTPDRYQVNGASSIATKGATSIIHIFATGAISFHGVPYVNPLAFSESTALAAATSAVQNMNGMPADAVLSEVDEQYESTSAGVGTALTGYVFTWKHSNTAANQNDAIRLNVTDYHTSSSVCTGGYKIIYVGQKPISLCQGWTVTTTDTPNISYLFRMWRSVGSPNIKRASSQYSIPASTAALALPAGVVVAAYFPGSWAGLYDSAQQSTATPAWVFESTNGTYYFVDAALGVLLSSASSIG
jgi:hypothetical protein